MQYIKNLIERNMKNKEEDKSKNSLVPFPFIGTVYKTYNLVTCKLT